ncbi:MAG: alpha/beta hydrolase-fold protein [Actinomycetota bacterium]|nr:alpha/beta hydrolase-fold protein [Actinomycetota bacterium]
MTAASIQSSEVFNVASEHTGDVYQISVGLPMSYFDDPNTTFPVVYLIDANLAFEAVVGLARLMQLGGVVPEFAVVGIGYPLEGNYGDGLGEFFERRARDLTSAIDERYEQFIAKAFGINGTVETGGSEQFLGFIADELVPLVEEQYRLDPDDRTLMGHSAGGHFALYALLHQPQNFKRYAIGSPSLGLGNGHLYDLEQELASKSGDLPVRLFLGIGSEEEPSPQSPASYMEEIISVSHVRRFTSLLEDRGYESLFMSTKVFEGHGHFDVFGPFVASGLRYLFSNR